MPDSENLKV